MKKEMEPSGELQIQKLTDEIIAYVRKYGFGKNQAYKSLHAEVCSVTKRVRYFALMGVFSRNLKNDNLKAQTMAGRMLLKITPKVMEKCEEAVFRLLGNWDVSAEEVIYYLREQFGAENLLATIALMKNTSLQKNDMIRLETMEYWVKTNQIR